MMKRLDFLINQRFSDRASKKELVMLLGFITIRG